LLSYCKNKKNLEIYKKTNISREKNKKIENLEIYKKIHEIKKNIRKYMKKNMKKHEKNNGL
jgi:hypothetical protein